MPDDYWRDARDHKRRARATWAECPRDGSKVPPGDTCLHCGWEAPKGPRVKEQKK